MLNPNEAPEGYVAVESESCEGCDIRGTGDCFGGICIAERRSDGCYVKFIKKPATEKSRSDGSTASYYELPAGCTELQHLISHRNMNAQIGEIFRACYRYGLVEHSECLRDAKKILFYAKAEVERLEGMGK